MILTILPVLIKHLRQLEESDRVVLFEDNKSQQTVLSRQVNLWESESMSEIKIFLSHSYSSECPICQTMVCSNVHCSESVPYPIFIKHGIIMSDNNGNILSFVHVHYLLMQLMTI